MDLRHAKFGHSVKDLLGFAALSPTYQVLRVLPLNLRLLALTGFMDLTTRG